MPSWKGKIIGGAVGFVVGGPVGAVVGAGIGAGIDEAAGGSSSGLLSVEGRSIDDELGRLVSLEVAEDIPEQSMAIIHFLDDSATYVKGRGYYTDSDGDFSLASQIVGKEIVFYIPFGSLILPRPAAYKMRITVVAPSGDAGERKPLGYADVAMTLPRWDKLDMVKVIEPLVALSMLVARSDAAVKPEEIRLLRELLTEAFELSIADMPQLRDAMKEARKRPIESLVDQCLHRVPSMNQAALIGLLAQVAHCEGEVDAQEVLVIRAVARALGFDESKVDEVVDHFGLKPIDHFKTLGLRRDAAKREVVSAYRKLVSMYHPDRVAGMAPDFQDVATKKFIEIQTAYEALMEKY